MRKGLLTLVLAFTAVLQTAWAYDFSATSPSGHTLYYEIITGTTNVGVVRPGVGYDNEYDDYVSGDVVIPTTVVYNDTTYNVIELRTIYDSTSGLHWGSFDGCISLTSITIPNSVTSIENGAFYNCSGLTSVTIPNTVTSIENGAFYNCSGLTSVTIPNSVTYIGDDSYLSWGVFENCTGLTSITIPNSVTYIGYGAFRGCTGLISVTIPNSVTSIDGTFGGCTGLTSVTIPNSVTSIGYGAFRGCTGLTSVTIPNSVTSIGYGAFSGCTGLTSITIPNNVTSIGDEAFENCTGLTSVTIGNSVRQIFSRAFYGCNSLYEVLSLAIYPPHTREEIFSDTAIIKIPCGSANFYNNAAYGWSQYFIDIEEICDNITITVASGNDSIGTVSGGGEYEFGAEVTITATAYEGYRFVSWNDGNTDNPHTITVTEDATYIATFEKIRDSTTGIEDVAAINAKIYSSRSRIVVEGAEGNNVMLFDMQGRLLATKRDEYSILEFEVPVSGAYFVRIGNYKAKKVVVIK